MDKKFYFFFWFVLSVSVKSSLPKKLSIDKQKMNYRRAIRTILISFGSAMTLFALLRFQTSMNARTIRVIHMESALILQVVISALASMVILVMAANLVLVALASVQIKHQCSQVINILLPL